MNGWLHEDENNFPVSGGKCVAVVGAGTKRRSACLDRAAGTARDRTAGGIEKPGSDDQMAQLQGGVRRDRGGAWWLLPACRSQCRGRA